jgi:ketosteroid isomerase-like protein
MSIPREEKERAEAFTHEWIQAWNSHDVERIVGHYADQLHYVSPLVEKRFPELEGVITDRVTLGRYVAMGLEKRPHLHFTLIGVLHSVRGFVMFYRNAFGTHSAEYIELDEHGHARLSIACYSEQPLPMA